MVPVRTAIRSTLGKKFIMSLTGFGLVIFLILHLIGNLPLYTTHSDTYNAYADKLESFGLILDILEIGLFATVIIHAASGIWLKLLARHARPQGYAVSKSKRGPSKSGFSSRNLVITGMIVLFFLIVHIRQFKFGPGLDEGYSAQFEGRSIRDLHKLVLEVFHQPQWAAFYVLSVALLGFHIKHGVWSAFQSLGATNSRTTLGIYRAGTLLAWILALGFMLMPIWIYFDLPLIHS